MTPLSIYVHWPFCKSKCPYCDFNSHVRAGVEHQRWQQALVAELAAWARRLPGRRIESIFFGGGTPSLMQPDTVAAIIDAAQGAWVFANDIEITLEANPTSVEMENLQGFREAGVNRVSLGVQALRAKDLSFLGREHSADEALHAIAIAKSLFERVSFDLIYARPHQTLQDWEVELTQALAFACGHLSLYQLTIEENTAFYHSYKQGKFTLPDEETSAALYQLTDQLTRAQGLQLYEISNYAAAGQESVHNLVYWRGGDYIGIGPGAHGRVSFRENASTRGNASPDFAAAKSPPRGRREALLHDYGGHVRVTTENIKSPERWLEAMEQGGQGATTETALSAREHVEELVMMGMRLASGIDYADWQQRTGVNLQPVFTAKMVEPLVAEGLVIVNADSIKATDKGRLLLNAVTAKLLRE